MQCCRSFETVFLNCYIKFELIYFCLLALNLGFFSFSMLLNLFWYGRHFRFCITLNSFFHFTFCCVRACGSFELVTIVTTNMIGSYQILRKCSRILKYPEKDSLYQLNLINSSQNYYNSKYIFYLTYICHVFFFS